MSGPLAQDPDEMFDIIDMYGAPTGVVKRRADVHRDGDWHRAIHAWLYGRDESGTFLMLQRRGLEKDSWPGRLDATAAGHLTAGETPENAFREIEEELGFEPDVQLLQHVGTRVIAGEEPPVRFDREFEEIYLLRVDQPLTGYHPNPVEVDALVQVRLEEWLAFLFGQHRSVAGQIMLAGGRELNSLHITPDQLIPSPDRYYHRVAVACQRALEGERYLVV